MDEDETYHRLGQLGDELFNGITVSYCTDADGDYGVNISIVPGPYWDGKTLAEACAEDQKIPWVPVGILIPQNARQIALWLIQAADLIEQDESARWPVEDE